MTVTSTASTAPPSGAEPNGSRARRPRISKRSVPYLLLAPALFFELLVHIVPMLGGLWMSFLRLNQFFLREWMSAPFTGLQNYRFALDFDGAAGVELFQSFAVTIAFAVITVGASWVMGLAAALFLQRSFPGRTLLRGLFLVPYALPIYTSVMIWKFMLDRSDGMVNATLSDLGLGGERFWLLGNNAFLSLTVTAIWRLWPFAFLALMAGLQSIPTDIYDAAAVDGAGLWQQIRTITVPMLQPVSQVLILVLFLWTFNDFNVPYLLFDQAVPSSANLISIHIYQNSFLTWNFGLGSAMSTLLLLFLLVITAGYLMLTSRRSRNA
ncbi:carbohydrate ABC transporter membrane protein 1, CUT1 family (TC 3.A.1.1.-) [Actinopolyspora lacussalsi subsp. righensis]|uniref:Carbohydrate ABC transporter membrane protein 1, CUT1 family (TC 3.A.1.1.-) n=1 Tax=Actinopolyspora righensis TaxID=995060 RepID=A0A1I6X447_9ACTN|nr:sugar ABC transporter permease [Actinopolyspora righensis]SFT33013.1 carbohydrate ABC transporter membrane protein 1, CUT1 family (TC 3.A.1.1.-) [Actinopolyspora righensis]